MDSKTETVLQYAMLVMSMTLDFQMGKITPALYVSNLLMISNQLSEKFNSQSPDTIEMDRPIDVIDSLSEQSLKSGQSKEEWLETLRELRDEIDIQIENVER